MRAPLNVTQIWLRFSVHSLDHDCILPSSFSSIHMNQVMKKRLISVQFRKDDTLRRARDQRLCPCYRHARQASFRVDLALLSGMQSPLQAGYWLILAPQRPKNETNFTVNQNLSKIEKSVRMASPESISFGKLFWELPNHYSHTFQLKMLETKTKYH